jgi:hypothetical protein
MRDLIELEFLLRYFTLYPDQIETWWATDRKTRMKKYSPAVLRYYISEGIERRKEIFDDNYIGHCEIAAHPTPESMKLQHNKGKRKMGISSNS